MIVRLSIHLFTLYSLASLYRSYRTQSSISHSDIFLARSVSDTKPCDWHVDDNGFWPESYISTASNKTGKDQNGINAWVALDDMPAMYQGSMAVSPGSHKASWSPDAFLALGQNRSEDGGRTRKEIVRAMAENVDKRYPTCELYHFAPEIRSQIEDTSRIVDVKRGDIVFATRLLFHRTLAVTEDGVDYYKSIGKDLLRRYSIRCSRIRAPSQWLECGMECSFGLCQHGTQIGRYLLALMEQSFILVFGPTWMIPFKRASLSLRLDR